MNSFAEYSRSFETIDMRREDGILEMRFHTGGGPLQWSLLPHGELERAFLAVGRDRENQVVILTGTGTDFSGPRVAEEGHFLVKDSGSAQQIDHIYWEGKHLLMNLLNIEVPVIAAVNGPAVRHAEIPLLSDIVLAAEEAQFQDSAHFNGGLVPGDGVHVVFPLLMGVNRGRYFLLTGQTLSAREALEYGLVNEVLPRAELLPRAWTLARQLMRRSPLIRRYSRVVLTQDLKRRMHDLLGYGLALESLALRCGPE
jgi:enoyl-CoA hydratase/carnithine racemase